MKGGSILEKLLYIFVCNDERTLDEVYKGNKLMKEVKKEIKELTGDFDSLLYYDKEGLEKRMGEWVGKRSVIREMLKESYSKNEIKKICKLDDKEFSEMLEEIEKGW